MHVFLTGANGWVGSVIARDLLNAGHTVVGLVRSTEKADALAAAGIRPLLGTLSDLDVLRHGAGDADGIIHTAFDLDMSKIGELSEGDRMAIETFGEVFAGSDRPIVVTGGVGLLPRGEPFRAPGLSRRRDFRSCRGLWGARRADPAPPLVAPQCRGAHADAAGHRCGRRGLALPCGRSYLRPWQSKTRWPLMTCWWSPHSPRSCRPQPTPRPASPRPSP